MRKKLLLALLCLVAIGVTAGEKQVYTVFKYSTNRLTYYYDDQMANRSGDHKELYVPNQNRFQDYALYVDRIEIDQSMKNAQLTTMKNLFCGWTGILKNVAWIDSIHNLNTASVTDMSQMFWGLESLIAVDLFHFNTSNVTNMSSMFARCSRLTESDLRYFDVSKVSDASYMFSHCTALQSIYCRDRWIFGHSTNMFQDCNSLQGDKGTQYNDLYAKDYTLARPDGGSASPGYFSVPPCRPVLDLWASNITSTSITVAWNAGADENEWRISYKIKDAPDDRIKVVVNSSPYTINSLLPNTTYEILIASKCGDEYSVGNQWIEETTLPEPCQTPTSLRVVDVTPRTATISFTPGSDDQSLWVVLPGIPGRYALPEQYATSSTYVINGLSPNTTYGVSVKARCGDSDGSNDSEWTGMIEFTTAPNAPEGACAAPTGVQLVGNPKSTEATLTWTPGASSQSKWLVEYRDYMNYGGGTSRYAEATSIPFTLKGLIKNTPYRVYIIGKCADNLWSSSSQSFAFTTANQDEQGIEDVQPDKLQGTKLLRDGQLLIERNGKLYNAQGAEVR